MAIPIEKHDDVISGNARVLYLVPQEQPKLKKDGTPKKICQNKKKGRSSKVEHLEIQDMKNIISYFKENEKWLPYLIFVLSCNMARRVGDTMNLKWEHFFNPATGQFRSNLLEIVEDKTDKLANPRINAACREAITLYIEKTGCDPSLEGYMIPICKQLTGNFKGRVLSESSYYKSVKEAAARLGIEYNVGTHSPRKTFGMVSRMIHPGDYDTMEILQSIFNHSDAKTTRCYIGLTKQKMDGYYDDMGEFFTEYITGGKEYSHAVNSPIISVDVNDLRDVLKMAYESGRNNAASNDAMVHVNAITKIMAMVDSIAK